MLARALSERVENARVLLGPCSALFWCCPVATEHPLEDDAWVDFHRQRLIGRCPADRAHVGAEEVAGAAPEMAGVILGGELHRRERRLAPDLLGDDLVDRRSK